MTGDTDREGAGERLDSMGKAFTSGQGAISFIIIIFMNFINNSPGLLLLPSHVSINRLLRKLCGCLLFPIPELAKTFGAHAPFDTHLPRPRSLFLCFVSYIILLDRYYHVSRMPFASPAAPLPQPKFIDTRLKY